MGTRKVRFNDKGIGKLPDNKPVVYKILTNSDTNNYTGIAQRGRVKERLKEHLGDIPGASIQIEQMSSIKEAQEKETRIISRSKPRYNKQQK